MLSQNPLMLVQRLRQIPSDRSEISQIRFFFLRELFRIHLLFLEFFKFFFNKIAVEPELFPGLHHGADIVLH